MSILNCLRPPSSFLPRDTPCCVLSQMRRTFVWRGRSASGRSLGSSTSAGRSSHLTQITWDAPTRGTWCCASAPSCKHLTRLSPTPTSGSFLGSERAQDHRVGVDCKTTRGSDVELPCACFYPSPFGIPAMRYRLAAAHAHLSVAAKLDRRRPPRVAGQVCVR